MGKSSNTCNVSKYQKILIGIFGLSLAVSIGSLIYQIKKEK